MLLRWDIENPRPAGLPADTPSPPGTGWSSWTAAALPTARRDITDPSAPEAAFAASTYAGTAPLEVSFQDDSIGVITACAGTTATERPPRRRSPPNVFDTAGTYVVTLTVLGPWGQRVSAAAIQVAEPTITVTPGVRGRRQHGQRPIGTGEPPGGVHPSAARLVRSSSRWGTARTVSPSDLLDGRVFGVETASATGEASVSGMVPALRGRHDAAPAGRVPGACSASELLTVTF